MYWLPFPQQTIYWVMVSALVQCYNELVQFRDRFPYICGYATVPPMVIEPCQGSLHSHMQLELHVPSSRTSIRQCRTFLVVWTPCDTLPRALTPSHSS